MTIGSFFAILGGPPLFAEALPMAAGASAVGVLPVFTAGAVPATAPAVGVGVKPTIFSSGSLSPSAATATGVGVTATVSIVATPPLAAASGVGVGAVWQTFATPNVAGATAAGNSPTITLASAPAAAPAVGVGVNPSAVSSGNVHPPAATATAVGVNPTASTLPPIEVMLLAGAPYTSMTQTDFNTLASWGVGSVVMGSSSGNISSWPFGFGGSQAFNGGSSNTFQNQLAAKVVLAHNAGIKCYLGIYLQNYNWGTVANTNPGPCLGSWDPAFTDKNGHGWGAANGSTAGSWNQMAYNYGAAIAQMNMDGMFWDTEGGGFGSGPTNTVSCTMINTHTGITAASGTFSGISAGATITGTDIPAGTVVSVVNSSTSITMSKAATGSTTANLTFTGPASSDFMSWQWRYFANNYGQTSSEPTEFANAQTAGANMMEAINTGFQASGGNSVIPGGAGGDVPVYIYQSSVVGLPQFQNGYLDVVNTFQGNTINIFIHGSGFVATAYHTAIGYSTWTSFITGVASETSAPVVIGDATFYPYQIVNSGGPYSSDSDGGWTRALAADASALAGLGLGGNVSITPFLWIYDSTAGNGGAGVWTQTAWNQAQNSILAGVGNNAYMIFQFTNLLSGSTLVTNYASNPNSSPAGANYTPLNE